MRFLFLPQTHGMTTPLLTGPSDAHVRLVLAHGAGAGMRSPFLESLAGALGQAQVQTLRFEFGYMAARRNEGIRRPPPRMPVLEAEYTSVLRGLADAPPIYIGGKSMGGRVASLIADELYRDGHISGLVLVGYPFHPAGRPTSLRTEHLTDLTCPTLIVQGTRDPLGSFDEVAGYGLSPAVRVHWLEDGDHDLKPRRASGFTQADHIATAAREIARFMGLP